ncbi:Six-hairpin glycosidase-like protein [Aspergillus pseudoustus]|uniref:Six-hairpin glycosidase-like protein n=1 Tax=Aspergillus pseudoustus TaxID=1810923 RepID=A0ABR4JJ95_9EURO
MTEQIPEQAGTGCNAALEAIVNNTVSPLYRWLRTPQQIISFVPTQKPSFFGLQPSSAQHDISDLSSLTWGRGADIILDFGIHMVGHLSFRLTSSGEHMDAPCRVRLTFGESPLDVTMGMEHVQTWISTAWLPDEVINFDELPQQVSLSRRYSFRYLRIEVIDTSPKFKISFSDISCECTGAISQNHPIDKTEFDDPLLRDIDHVSISTLRDCMQTVFEDGPRRDRRLWIGDLRLQAQANYSTFRDFNLVKRCIFQFAAAAREDGSLPACVFHTPRLAPSTDYIVDYDALFSSVVHDYVVASGDVDTGHTLWPTVLKCVERALAHLDPRTHTFELHRGEGFKFLDWATGLDKTAGCHGLLLFCLRAVNSLAARLGKEPPFADTVTKMASAATCFLRRKDGLFISGPQNQISYASAAWLVLSQAFPVSTARDALLNTIAHPDAVKPLTPYLWHYVCEALMTVGCYEECIGLIRRYWGGMVDAGADTFWECYDPKDPMASPYGDVRNNSFCHAWSCTPAYFLRGPLLGKVGGRVAGSITMGELDRRWVERSITAVAQGGPATAVDV